MSEYTPTTAAVRSGYAATEHFAAAFDRWQAAHDAQVAARALREVAFAVRHAWGGSWNLPDPEDPEVFYSVDRWIEVRADRIERGDLK